MMMMVVMTVMAIGLYFRALYDPDIEKMFSLNTLNSSLPCPALTPIALSSALYVLGLRWPAEKASECGVDMQHVGSTKMAFQCWTLG